MSKKSEVIENKSEIELELSRVLDANLKEYFKEAEKIIKRLDERRKVNKEFLAQIEVFIEYAKNQVKNKGISEETRLRYMDLIEEEKSLHDRINKDLKRNNELIESIKKSTNVLFR